MTPEQARQEALDALERAKARILEDMPDRAQAEATIGLAYAMLGGVLPEDVAVDDLPFETYPASEAFRTTPSNTPWGNV